MFKLNLLFDFLHFFSFYSDLQTFPISQLALKLSTFDSQLIQHVHLIIQFTFESGSELV